VRIAEVVVAKKLSVRETEKLVESMAAGKKRSKKPADTSSWTALEASLQKRLGTKITIQPRGKGGKIVIHYFSPEELDGLVDAILA